mgnify:FL=1|jgi:hypothetical protein
MSKFLKLDNEVFNIFWPDLSKLFIKVIKTQASGRDSLELLHTKISNNLLDVWVYRGEDGVYNDDGVIEAAFCTAITEYPDKRSLFWGYMSADNNTMNNWKESLWTTLRNYGNQNQCDCIEYFSNRTGWTRVLEENDDVENIEPIGTIFEIKL